MSNIKTTKRALLLSVLSLMVCVSMLIGSTFAWFTDSVTSGTNTIKAGNLDVKLYHSDKAVTDAEVTDTTKLFDDVALWEPGAVVYENFKIANEGSLALKYVFNLKVTNATVVDGKSLADVLKVAVVEGGFNGDRAAAIGNSFNKIASFEENKALSAGADRTFGVIIYWEPTANDNDYNKAGEVLKANIGVTLVATQKTEESDSFGDDYDFDAKLPNVTAPTVTAGSAETLKKAIAQFTAGTTVVLEDNIDLKNQNWATTAPFSASGTDVVFDGNYKTISNLTTDGVYGGLFGKFNSKGNITIKNLTLENVTLTGTNEDGEGSGGALIGWAENHGGTLTLENVTVKNVNIKDFKYIGGLVGYTSTERPLNIVNCTVEGNTINSTYSENAGTNVKGHVGGIIGYYTEGKISGCEVKGLIILGSTTAKRHGALIGSAEKGVVVGEGNKINNVTINGAPATADTVIGSVDNRTDKSGTVDIQ